MSSDAGSSDAGSSDAGSSDAGSSDAGERRLPLAGVRVLSQSIVWAGPFGSMILADLGAEVIEIESIQHLNPTRTSYRHFPPALEGTTTGASYVDRDFSEGFWNRHGWFNYGKRGHKSVTLDLGRERGRELFRELVRRSDVFIENNAAAVVEHLGIDYPTLAALNPRLIMVRFPGFGIEGPYSHFKGYGSTMESLAGHTLLRGYEDADPSLTMDVLHGDPNAGAHVAYAVQVALYARDTTGEGQLVDLSQSEAVIQHLTYAFMDYSMNQRVEQHWGNRHPSMAPYGVFPCAGEDRWIAIAVPSDEAFESLCTAMGRPGLADEERFADTASRYRQRDVLHELVSAWTAQHDHYELMLRLQAAGVSAAALLHQEEMHDDPHLVARGYFERITHPEAGTHRYPGPMARFREQPLQPVRGPAPTLGQHNREVLRDLAGLSEDEYQELVDDEIVGTVYREDAN